MKLRLVGSLIVALPLAFGACKKGEEGGGEGSGEATMTHKCKIIVVAKQDKKEAETYKGQGKGEDEKAAEEEAWKQACEAIPEADRAECRNNERFSWTKSGVSVEQEGKKIHTVTISLKANPPKPEEHSGEATSKDSSDKACAEALAKACEAAGAKGDCVAAGTHEQMGKSSESSAM
ncbi:MAG: hypothetical protein KJO07_19870 [Deltaproteobacteria bacterium]|nr:hypothetical protein [Deltaproteobacteria bacterium]